MLTSQQNLTAAKQTVMSKCPHSERKTQLIKSAPMDLLTSRQLDDFQENAAVFAQVNAWVKNYLARPHKDLGRPGTVCPFAPEALMRDSIRVAVVRLTRHAESEIEAAVDHFRQVFHELEPSSGDGAIYKAILMAFPDVSLADAPRLIDVCKERLKPEFVREGLMLGEFHELNESPGLHNPDFRPLRCPVPLLAIRHMVYSDIVFLNRPTDPIDRRIRFLEAYLNPRNALRPQDREAANLFLAELRQIAAAEPVPVT